MSKIIKRIRRTDTEDHRHRLPDGSYTGGALHKPSKDQFDMHSHLYEFEEDTLETTVMHSFGDHVHETEVGPSSGPVKMDKEPGDSWEKMDACLPS